jgi:hypothetical protein
LPGTLQIRVHIGWAGGKFAGLGSPDANPISPNVARKRLLRGCQPEKALLFTEFNPAAALKLNQIRIHD